MNYYDRNVDSEGSTYSPEDQSNEAYVARTLEQKWACKFNPYSKYNEIDWWIEKNKQVMALAELKCTSKANIDYAMLNCRKYLNLLNVSRAGNVPGLFLFLTPDKSIRCIDICKEEGFELIIVGGFLKSNNDREPVFKIPFERMQLVHGLSTDV